MGTSDQRFSLRWNNYQSHLVTAFESLLEEKDFVDVTLGVEGRKLPAHKMLLSACSPYFRDLLKGNPCQHPIIVLRDIKYDDLFSLLQFMYNGEVNVAQDQLNSFLKSAESLKIRGLTDNDSASTNEETTKAPPLQPSSNESLRDLHQQPPIKRKRPYPDQPSPTPSPKRVVSAPILAPPLPPTQSAPRQEPVKQEVIDLGDDQYEETDAGQYDGNGEGEEGVYAEGQGGYSGEGAMVPHGESEEGLEAGDGTQGGGWYPEVQSGIQCEQCFKVFTNKNAFTNHLPSHEGKTICKHCGKFFSSPSNLNKHVRKNHIFSTHMESQENQFS